MTREILNLYHAIQEVKLRPRLERAHFAVPMALRPLVGQIKAPDRTIIQPAGGIHYRYLRLSVDQWDQLLELAEIAYEQALASE